MDTPFEAYVTNLGKYNEGRLVGENLKFPTTTEEVQALLKDVYKRQQENRTPNTANEDHLPPLVKRRRWLSAQAQVA